MFLASFGLVLAVDMPTGTGLPETSPVDILQNVLTWSMLVVAIISVLVIVIAGVRWATAGGDEERQGSARKMLIAGVVGLVIALAAYGIINVVVESFIG